jgi:hypothetical protein
MEGRTLQPHLAIGPVPAKLCKKPSLLGGNQDAKLLIQIAALHIVMISRH